MEINNTWSGILSQNNIEAVATAIRERLDGRVFSIASCEYADSGDAKVRLITSAKFNSDWTDGSKENVRVMLSEDGKEKWIGFSAGGYFWTWHPSEGDDHHCRGGRGAYIAFDYDSFQVEQFAPAGKGYLHKHIFKSHREL